VEVKYFFESANWILLWKIDKFYVLSKALASLRRKCIGAWLQQFSL